MRIVWLVVLVLLSGCITAKPGEVETAGEKNYEAVPLPMLVCPANGNVQPPYNICLSPLPVAWPEPRLRTQAVSQYRPGLAALAISSLYPTASGVPPAVAEDSTSFLITEDGGDTWREVFPPVPTLNSGSALPLQYAGSNALVWDEDDTLHVVQIVGGPQISVQGIPLLSGPRGVAILTTRDLGQSWLSTTFQNEWYGTIGATSNGLVVATLADGGVRFRRSMDGGNSWSLVAEDAQECRTLSNVLESKTGVRVICYNFSTPLVSMDLQSSGKILKQSFGDGRRGHYGHWQLRLPDNSTAFVLMRHEGAGSYDPIIFMSEEGAWTKEIRLAEHSLTLQGGQFTRLFGAAADPAGRIHLVLASQHDDSSLVFSGDLAKWIYLVLAPAAAKPLVQEQVIGMADIDSEPVDFYAGQGFPINSVQEVLALGPAGGLLVLPTRSGLAYATLRYSE